MISMRGQASDYDHWRQLGLAGWGWDDVRPVFKRLDDHFMGEFEHHGVDGEWRVERPGVSRDVLDSVAKAAVEMGIPMTPDFNTGLGLLQTTDFAVVQPDHSGEHSGQGRSDHRSA